MMRVLQSQKVYPLFNFPRKIEIPALSTVDLVEVTETFNHVLKAHDLEGYLKGDLVEPPKLLGIEKRILILPKRKRYNSTNECSSQASTSSSRSLRTSN